MKKHIKSTISDFKRISWAKKKDVLIGIRDVLIFSFITGGIFLIIDLIAGILMKEFGG